MTTQGSFKRDYEVAKLKAKCKALEYENDMLKSLFQSLYLNQTPTSDTRVGVTSKPPKQPTQKPVPQGLVFTKADFEDYDEEGLEEFEEEGEKDYAFDEEEEYYDEYDGCEDDEVISTFNEAISGRHGKKKEEEAVKIETDYQQQQEAMQLLFGSQANSILAAETKMQLCFEKACDRHQPQLWPCLPLNMKFD